MIRQLFAEKKERRDKVQIFADIIKVAARPTRITRILRVANIQYNAFQDCIDKLCKAGLLEMIPVNRRARSSPDNRTRYVFKATDIGIKWCRMVEEVYETIGDKTQKRPSH